MKPYVVEDTVGNSRTILVRNAEAPDRASITLTFDTDAGPSKALGLLARAALEVYVAARKPKADA